jgi:hypothetical protein
MAGIGWGMALRVLRTVRVGVLISLVISGCLLWSVARTAWWSERTDVAGFRYVEVGLTGFGGSAFVWCAAGSCLAYAISALPLPPRIRRAATGAGLAATAAAAVMWGVLMARVLRRDAETHLAWAPEVWARRLADPAGVPGPALTETDSGGLGAALVVVFLLLVIGCVLAVPRRHERSVLLTAAIVNVVAGVSASPTSIWVTTGPQTVEADWYRLSDLFKNETVSAVVLGALVPLLGIGLLLPPQRLARRGWAVAWAATACVCCYASNIAVMIDLAFTNWSPISGEVKDAPPLIAPGAGITGLLLLVIFLPLIVSVRVAFADAAARRKTKGAVPTGDHSEHRSAPGSAGVHAFGEHVPPDDVRPVLSPVADISEDDVPPDDDFPAVETSAGPPPGGPRPGAEDGRVLP